MAIDTNVIETNHLLGGLLPRHREDFLRSGLLDESIKKWGVYSIEADQKCVMAQLGFPYLNPPALALPILRPDQNEPNLNNVILKPDSPNHHVARALRLGHRVLIEPEELKRLVASGRKAILAKLRRAP